MLGLGRSNTDRGLLPSKPIAGVNGRGFLMKAKCDCHSYNGDFGSKREVLLSMPVRSKPAGEDWQIKYKKVNIDACIAPILKHLWQNNVVTEGSCCGHNRQSPSIVLGQGVENYSEVRKLIKQKDSRWFELSQWKRVLV